ncbi:MAG: hypothetical protein ACLF0G_17740 [Candidatus Brocadiia bacterium]
MSSYDFFGATPDDVLRRLPGAVAADLARRAVAVRPGSSPDVVQLDTTEGLAAGDLVNVHTGAFPPQGESRAVASVDSPTQLTLAEPFSQAPLSGDVVNDGPSVLRAALAGAEACIEAALPDRYRRLLRRVEGELLVDRATAGQLAAALALRQATGLVLYADYAGPYADRGPDDAMEPSRYALEPDGQTVVFSPALAEGTRVLADYEHDLADGVEVLADLAAELAAARLARFVLGHQPRWVEALAAQAEGRLAALAEGRAGVPELDAVRLVEDWERAAGTIRAGTLRRR